MVPDGASAELGQANPLFDHAWYLARYADVAAAGVDAWSHFLRRGAAEGRDPNPLFDSDWYLSRYPEVARAGHNPLLHYWQHGAHAGYEPNALFDGASVLRNAVAQVGATNPLLHYLRHDSKRWRDTSSLFDSAWYARSNPDLDFATLPPLADYIQFGQAEGRTRLPPDASSAPPAEAPPDDAGARRRFVVYTAIVDDYDALKLPTVVAPDCDYVCFTDRDISWQGIWARRPIEWKHADPVRMSRQPKVNPHEYFPDHEMSLWVDASIRLDCKPHEFVPSFDGWDVAAFRHPFRDCVYDEAARCITLAKDDPDVIDAQMQRYRQAGVREHSGLTENGVLVRRHNTPTAIRFADAWWREQLHGSRRDQLSFGVAARHAGARLASLGPVGNSVRNDARVTFFAHKQQRPRW